MSVRIYVQYITMRIVILRKFNIFLRPSKVRRMVPSTLRDLDIVANLGSRLSRCSWIIIKRNQRMYTSIIANLIKEPLINKPENRPKSYGAHVISFYPVALINYPIPMD
jgi:hypothetical protein